MRSITKAAALAVVLAILAQNMAHAADYIADAAEALEQARVYVATGTEGTDRDTAGKLQSRLTSDDNIVLVMLPSTAEEELGADIDTIARRLSEELGDQRIIGLAVGNKVVGYAPTLPTGVAADQMRRAKSVSNDPVTALGTFVQNVHRWQAEHPKPEPPMIPIPGDDGWSWLWWLVSGGIVVAIIAAAIRFRRRRLTLVPGSVQDLLDSIALTRERVKDWELKEELRQLHLDIVRYFRSSSKDKKRDSLFFKDRLTEASDILEKYLDVQDNPRYYLKQRTVLAEGKEALTDFCDYVLESIQRGSDADLEDYRLKTTILQEHRRLANPDLDFERALEDAENGRRY